MDSLTYNIIIPSPIGLAIGTLGGTLFGVAKGIHNREFVDFRSGTKCVLRNFMLSLTITGLASLAFSAFVLAAMNTSLITMSALSGAVVTIFFVSGLNIFELSNKYEQILRLFLDRLIVSQ